MPTYTYTGDEGRYYSTLGLLPDPGGEYELDRNPGDGRWTPPDPEPEIPAAVADPAAADPASPVAAVRAPAKKKEA